MIQADDDILLSVSDYDEKAALLLLSGRILADAAKSELRGLYLDTTPDKGRDPRVAWALVSFI